MKTVHLMNDTRPFLERAYIFEDEGYRYINNIWLTVIDPNKPIGFSIFLNIFGRSLKLYTNLFNELI